MRVSILLCLGLILAMMIAFQPAFGSSLTVGEDSLTTESDALFLESEGEVDAEADADAEVDSEADLDVEAEETLEGMMMVETTALPKPGQKCGSGSKGTCTAKSAWCAASTVATSGLCTGANGVGVGFCCMPKTTAAAPAPASAPAPSTSSAGNAAAVQRAGTWVAAKLRYCQAPNGGRDASSACPRICSRQKNPAWDKYRSDCSGLVSFAWGLPAPGLTTSSLGTAAKVIQCSALQPGDAVNRSGSHTMLFVRWTIPGKQALFYEEPGCSMSEPWARAYTADLTCSGSNVVTSKRGTFVAMRKK